MSKKFNFNYGELIQRSDRLVALMQRDATQLDSLGYTAEYRTTLESKIAYFKTLSPDAYWQGQQMMKTEGKNVASRNLLNLLSEFRFRAKLALGAHSVAYRSFRFTKLSDLDDNQLIIFAGHVVRTAEALLDDLSIRKIDEASLNEISTTANILDDAIDAQKMAIATREEKTFEREEKANEIYDILSEICEVGKRTWEGSNQAFYDDYLIYGSSESIGEEEEEQPGETETGPVQPS